MAKELRTQVMVALALKGKTQSWLAHELEMNPGYLSRILNGKDSPKEQISRIKNLLGIEQGKEN